LGKFFILFFLVITAYGQTLKEISNIVGIRGNQLIGYGMVVGARAGGDSSISTQTLQNLLRNSNIKINPSDAGDTAAVIVTSTLPAFARQGDKLKVEVSSLDGADLDGAKLLVTQLKGIDGKVYAIAQGTIVGVTDENKNARGRRSDGSKTGYIYNGATVENELDYSLKNEKSITLSLLEQNAKIAALVEEKINDKFGQNIAYALDTRTIEVAKPKNMSIVRFIAQIEAIEIDTMMKKKVIIDPIKEIIVAGSDITINPVTISRENFTLRIKKSDLSEKAWADPAKNIGIDVGDDAKVQKVPGKEVAEVDVDNGLLNTRRQPTVSDLMRAMKTMKIDITEIIETMRMLDRLGAINADVEMVR